MMLSKSKLLTFISEGRRCNTDLLCTMRPFLAVVYEPPTDRIARVFCMYIYLFIYIAASFGRRVV